VNIVVEWLTLLLRIQEVVGSNLGAEAIYPEGFLGFPLSLQANAYDRLLPHAFQLITIILSFDYTV
jgi:hypothetical protein